MITIAMSAVVGAPRSRVWRAIADPDEIIQWDERLLGQIDVDEGYPDAEKTTRWRARLGSVQLVLNDRATNVQPLQRLESQVALGSMRFDQTYTLSGEEGAAPVTRLGLKLVTRNSVPLIGDVVDRFSVRRMCVERVDTSLRFIQKWCENHP